MPKSMFQDVVCPHADSTRKWYTLPLSFIIHTSILIVLVVIPLMAGDVLPSPRMMTTFVNPVEPPAPPPPMVTRHVSIQPAAADNRSAAPLQAPEGIKPDPGLVPEPEQAIGIPGVIEALGNTVSFEAPLPPPPPAVVTP